MAQEKILVIDDELFVRELLQEFLSKEGYNVYLAESGEKAIDLIKANPVEIALIDLKMPGMDGISTLKEIKKIAPETIAVILTGYPTIESSVEALRSGAYDYVVKPFKLNDLKNTIEKALNEYRLKSEIGELRKKIQTLEEQLKEYQKAGKKLPSEKNINQVGGENPQK
ncbi:MAG: response regulator [Candidatus Zixiibacteriota bacterium]